MPDQITFTQIAITNPTGEVDSLTPTIIGLAGNGEVYRYLDCVVNNLSIRGWKRLSMTKLSDDQ